ncbi:UNVERIFIED_CONTAM: PAS domain-containing sensor histidine kinase, partial [Salmonella enterica subsp. enterica serovar Weltevreden]
DVIQRMDEVYSQLVSDEIALEQKNVELEQSQQFILSVMSAMSDVLLVCNERGEIEETNAALCELVGRSDDELRGTPVFALLAD